MKQKGQLSFDFMLALIAFFIFIASINVISSGISDSANEGGVRSSERVIGMEVAETISAASALKDGTMNVSLQVKGLEELGKEGKTCSIQISDNSITVSNGKGIDSIVSFKKPSGINVPSTAQCGQAIQVTG